MWASQQLYEVIGQAVMVQASMRAASGGADTCRLIAHSEMCLSCVANNQTGGFAIVGDMSDVEEGQVLTATLYNTRHAAHACRV